MTLFVSNLRQRFKVGHAAERKIPPTEREREREREEKATLGPALDSYFKTRPA